MDALKQQLLRVQQQLAGLSASQKMLTASLVAIMVMTLFYWSHYAGSAELVPLIDKSLAADEMSQIKSSLEAKGVKFEMVGDKIMVSPDSKFGIVSDLGFDGALPRDMTSAFDEMVQQMSPLDPDSKSEKFYNHAREKTLGMLISRWPGVKSATIMIDTTRKNSPFNPIKPSATVDIQMKNGESPSKKTVQSARMSVAGTLAGMDPKDVKVTINGQTFDAGNPNDPFAMSGDGDNVILKVKSDWEKYYNDKIVGQMDIQGLRATVSVALTTSTKDSVLHTVDPKQKLSLIKREGSTSEDNTQGSTGGEPGAVPNTGVMADTATANPPQNQHKETVDNEFTNDYGKSEETVHAPAGDAVAITASVRVPESYFRKAWKVKHPSSTVDATDEEIDKLVATETPHIRDAIKSATNIKEDTAVSVNSYIDVDGPTLSPEPAGTGLAALPMTVGFGAKEIAIGALAVISLFMVSMMVRKSSPQPQLAIAGPASALGGELDLTSSSQPDFTNEVSEGGATMTGHELSDEAIEAKNVIEQVGAMVKENPDAAANLLKRWMNQP